MGAILTRLDWKTAPVFLDALATYHRDVAGSPFLKQELARNAEIRKKVWAVGAGGTAESVDERDRQENTENAASRAGESWDPRNAASRSGESWDPQNTASLASESRDPQNAASASESRDPRNAASLASESRVRPFGSTSNDAILIVLIVLMLLGLVIALTRW